MLLSKIKLNKWRSQALPGFAARLPRSFWFTLGSISLVLLVIAFGHISREFTFEIPQAVAASNPSDGIKDPVFTQTQTRYIQRALHARHDNIYELQGASVKAAFDEPELVRSDVPTTIWQYRNNICVLDVYFKSEDVNVTYAPVVHYEVRTRGDEAGISDAEKQNCFKSLLPATITAHILNVGAFYKR